MNLRANGDPAYLLPSVLVMLALFTAHVIIQHRLVSLGVAPVRTDPCDGVNAYAFITIVFVLICSIIRRLRRRNVASALNRLYTARSQQAVLFAIFMMYMGEIIALARNQATWIRIVPPVRLFALLGILTAATVATQLLIFIRESDTISPGALRWTHTILPLAVAIVALTLSPEWPTYSPSRTAHILTVALGALVVFIPLRVFLPEIVLIGSPVRRDEAKFPHVRKWAILTSGVVVTLFAFFRRIPFLVIDGAQLCIAYAVLGTALGFARRYAPGDYWGDSASSS